MPALRGGAVPRPLRRRAPQDGVRIQDRAVAPWPFDPRVDAGAFALLEFAGASAGIARTQRENREGWWAHARRSKAFILDAAARVERAHLAVVLGAGKAYDLPLDELARRFERLVLVDIDADALAATAAATLRKPAELRAMDITGVTARLARGIEQAIASSNAEAELEALCRSYSLASPPRLVPEGERADLIVSGMLLSQLCVQPKLAARRLYEKRLGAFPAPLVKVWDELELGMQKDHIDALTNDAELAVLTSDVIHRSGGETWSVVGAERLEERVPAFQQVLARATWSWPRVRGAVETSVDALLLRRR